MKIVKLTGGIGNQMFQYAFGKSLSVITGEEVLFDKINYEEQKTTIVGDTGQDTNGVFIREYELDIFNLDIKFATREQIQNCISGNIKKSKFQKILPKFLRKKIIPKNNIIVETPFNVYQSELFNVKGDAYYEGYFQCEKYFSNIIDSLKENFVLPPVIDQYNKDLIEKIENSQNPVAIHVRRGDYVNFGLDNLCDISFYRKATDYINSKVENPTFFVFCAEDPEWVRNSFNINHPFELIGLENNSRENYYENMRLMSICKHIIVANSSYSWWAAWLNKNPYKIVIAPDPWSDSDSGHICKSWIKIPKR